MTIIDLKWEFKKILTPGALNWLQKYIKNSFIENSANLMNGIDTDPIVRTYAVFKHSFRFENYVKRL